MNIGNITSNNFNLDGNGKDMKIEVYEQLIEQLQQENKKAKKVIDKLNDLLSDEFLEVIDRDTLLDILKEVE